MTPLIETSSDRWMRMIRGTGAVGLVTFVVLFAALIASSAGEPTFLASPEEALVFYLNTAAGWVQAAMAVMDLAAIGWIWFVVGLCLLLARAEGRSAPPTSIWQLGYAFDVISLGFANIWLLRLRAAVHSRRRSLAWLVGDRQRVGARGRPVPLDVDDLASAVCRLLDLDDHHVHPARPETGCGAEGSGRRASQPCG